MTIVTECTGFRKILMGKYHIHCSKWRCSKPSFVWFINDFKLFFYLTEKFKIY